MAERKQNKSWFLVLFGLVFALAGSAVLVFTLLEFAKTVDTYGWTRVPAEINDLTVHYPKKAPSGRASDVFELRADYSFRVDGEKHPGTKLRRRPLTDDSYSTLAKRRWQMIRDEVSHAYVDPDDETNAILERESLWSGLSSLFSLPFILIGLGCMAAGSGFFSGKESKKTHYVSNKQKAKTDRYGGLILALFGFFFVAFALGMLYPMLIRPLKLTRSAKSWSEVPCTVIWSRVVVHSGEDGDTYSPEVFYEYEFKHETHRSNRYSFVSGSSSGRSPKQKIVRSYPAGKQATCFVNPEKPWQATLRRDRKALGFWWLIPLVFLFVGAPVFVAGIRQSLFVGKQKDKSDRRKKRWRPPNTTDVATAESVYRETSASSMFAQPTGEREDEERVFHVGAVRWVTFFGSLAAGLFWNGIAAVLFLPAWAGMLRGQEVDLFLIIFSIPFLLIGAFIIGGAVYAFGGLFNPHMTLTVRPGDPRTGQEAIVEWSVEGGWTRINQLLVTFEGVEESTYQRGTDTITDDSIFYRQLLVDESSAESIHHGSVILELPLGIMPTLNLINNSIAWRLSVNGKIARWPDVFDIHELEILPFSVPKS